MKLRLHITGDGEVVDLLLSELPVVGDPLEAFALAHAQILADAVEFVRHDAKGNPAAEVHDARHGRARGLVPGSLRQAVPGSAEVVDVFRVRGRTGATHRLAAAQRLAFDRLELGDVGGFERAVAAYEALRPGSPEYESLALQLNELSPGPLPDHLPLEFREGAYHLHQHPPRRQRPFRAFRNQHPQHRRQSAGNRTRQTDSRGVVTNFTYDALNRLTTITYPAATAENVTYQYDNTSNGNRGIGRLTGVTRTDQGLVGDGVHRTA